MSLFNRPSWAKSQSTTDEAEKPEDNIFSHSSRSYREIVAEQERKKQAKIERKKQKEERRNSRKYEALTDSGEAGSSKRRRISLEDDEAVSDNGKPTPERSVSVEEITYDVGSARKSPPRRSPRKNRSGDVSTASPARAKTKATEAIELGDSDEDEDVTITAMKTSAEIIDEESDDEFAELARRAREERQRKQQQQQQQQSAKNSHTPDPLGRASSHDPSAANKGQSSLPTTPPDPSIALFISSRLPQTNPMIVYRKLSQNIADVRNAWCQRQGFSKEEARSIFFVHGMRRVYDVTTCRSLGLEVDSLGNVTLMGAEGKEDVEKVHLEAVNDEIFQQMKEEKAQAARRAGGDSSADAGAEEEHAEPRQEEANIRLLLKAKDMEDFKLKVKPTTTFAKIAAAYAKTHLTEDQSVYLAFDGDRLDPEAEVQNTEIADMDCIEVHIS